MASRNNIFTTIRTEGALLPADLLQRISEGATLEGLTPESYHRPGEKLNEAINRSWNALQGAWASFKTAQERLPENDLGTSITRERWLLPLFRELDYGRLQTASAVEIEGRSYPISHGWEHVPVHLVSYQLDLDKRTQGVAGASSASPHSLLQVFLNRSDNNLWGFLGNGYKLRILRDNMTLTRQAYVEFDLEAMMEGEVYSDFVLLWLLCHQSRVEGERPSDCWLEKWMKVAEDQGTRALDQLRDGVEAAITALGLGFLEHHTNAVLRDKLTSGELNAQDYYRQLLRMVYRLLFLFVAEDRDLLLNPDAPQDARERYVHYYSTQRLRRMAETFKGTRHPDLFESLRLVMRLLSGENNGAGAGLGLIPLGSFLFSDRAVTDIIDCQIANSHLLDAIRALSLTYDQRAQVYRTVDYKNLGSDELGSIFESLLELHPQINVPARRFALSTAAGNERKTTGSYYTPESLVHALLDSALNPVLAEATKKGEQAVLDLKVCDPACGSGHFLIAAANRMAKALAFVRTGEEEPPPAAIQEAKRDIISHCIYGVDINPMAVELCKVNLWMEALEPGKPLNFLDHRIQVGNSLLGTTPKLMAGGIPDDAFNPIEGDDPKYAATMKKVNKQERKDRASGQRSMFELIEMPADYSHLTEAMHALDGTPDDTLDAVRRKEAQYAALASDPEYVKARLLADAWCAAFVWEKKQNGLPMPMTDLLYRRVEENPLAGNLQTVREYVVELKERYQFFHWHVAFPDVFSVPKDMQHAENEQTGWHGGFDMVLGNPPWDKIQPEEQKFFATIRPDIAEIGKASTRKKQIEQLAQTDAYSYQLWATYKREIEGISNLVKQGNLLPLTASGNLNTYRLFSELSSVIVAPSGYIGLIVQTGIATDESGKEFFVEQLSSGRLIEFLDFENRGNFFVDVHAQFRFALITLAGYRIGNQREKNGNFGWMLKNLEETKMLGRMVSISSDDLFLFNPSSQTSPTFQSQRDLEISRTIYHNASHIFIDNERRFDQIDFLGEMFNLTRDSGLFISPDGIAGDYVPLYEAKCIHQFDHRYAGKINDDFGDYPPKLKQDPYCFMHPNNVVERVHVDKRIERRGITTNWFCGFRDISSSTNERTAIISLFPFSAVGNSINLALGLKALNAGILVANANAFLFDYTCRQKVSGTHVNIWIFKQLPVIPPHTYTPTLLDFIVPRVLELTYTAWDLQPFAQDVGWDGPPFVWDEERRFLMRCELDALYFHLYQINRDDVDYIMETFPIVKRKDIKATSDENGEGGEYVTKNVILEMYDQMAALPSIHVPAPKDETATYAVPDVSQWVTWLSPGPADERVAHEERGL